MTQGNYTLPFPTTSKYKKIYYTQWENKNSHNSDSHSPSHPQPLKKRRLNESYKSTTMTGNPKNGSHQNSTSFLKTFQANSTRPENSTTRRKYASSPMTTIIPSPQSSQRLTHPANDNGRRLIWSFKYITKIACIYTVGAKYALYKL
jgi:hypothetical protein